MRAKGIDAHENEFGDFDRVRADVEGGYGGGGAAEGEAEAGYGHGHVRAPVLARYVFLSSFLHFASLFGSVFPSLPLHVVGWVAFCSAPS